MLQHLEKEYKHESRLLLVRWTAYKFFPVASYLYEQFRPLDLHVEVMTYVV
jgi:hypothetical protein